MGRARGGLRAGRASGAAGLAATLRPDSTDSGRATGRARRPAQARSQRASEAAPRGKSQGGVPAVCAGGSVHLLSAARAARTRRPRRPQRARACAVPSRAPGPFCACACAVPLWTPGAIPASVAGLAVRPGLVLGPGPRRSAHRFPSRGAVRNPRSLLSPSPRRGRGRRLTVLVFWSHAPLGDSSAWRPRGHRARSRAAGVGPRASCGLSFRQGSRPHPRSAFLGGQPEAGGMSFFS